MYRWPQSRASYSRPQSLHVGLYSEQAFERERKLSGMGTVGVGRAGFIPG